MTSACADSLCIRAALRGPGRTVHLGYPIIDGSGIKLRAWLVLKNIERILTDRGIADGDLVNKIDKSRIYLIGHSRGGEAVIVARHILKTGMDKPTGGTLSGFSAERTQGIKGIVSLSPVTAAITLDGALYPRSD
jgi:hypothetical protein